jgi:hypothetical protein
MLEISHFMMNFLDFILFGELIHHSILNNYFLRFLLSLMLLSESLKSSSSNEI